MSKQKDGSNAAHQSNEIPCSAGRQREYRFRWCFNGSIFMRMNSLFSKKVTFTVRLTVPEVITRLQDLIETEKAAYYGSVAEQLDRVKKAFNGIPSVYTYPTHHETLLTGGFRKWYGGSIQGQTFKMFMLYRREYRVIDGKKIKSRAPLTPAESIFPLYGQLTEEQQGTRLEVSARMPFYHIAFILFFSLLCGIGLIGTLATGFREGFTPLSFGVLTCLATFPVLSYFLMIRGFKANIMSVEEDLRRLFADKLDASS